MIIKISKQKAHEVKAELENSKEVAITHLGTLKVKVRPSRKAYHNSTGKIRKIAGWKTIILIQNK